MPLDEATNRFAFLMQRDLRRFAERDAAKSAQGQELQYDSVARLATYGQRGGGVVSRHFTELLATYSPDERILKWAWAGRAPAASGTHVDLVFKEGQARGVPQLAMSIVADLDEVEAHKLASLGALVARARGMHVRTKESSVEFVGLYDRSSPRLDVEDGAPFGSASEEDQRYSVPPPEVAPTEPPPPAKEPKEEHRIAYRSLPPIREIYEPRTGGSRPPSAPPGLKAAVREPAREIFVPVATATISALGRASPGYRQGLFAVTIEEGDRGKRRIVVQLVALDAHGELHVLDPPPPLVDATAKMIEADRADGNGPWRKLHARITPKPNGGATLNVDVS